MAMRLEAYLAQEPPFDTPTANTTAKAWYVCQLPSHAASVERVSSLMGWYHTPVSSSLSTDTVAKILALKAHLRHNVPR